MRSGQEILCNFGLFLYEFGCHGNSLGSLENLDSIFEFADPVNMVSMSCTEMKLCLFECLAYLRVYATPLAPFCEKLAKLFKFFHQNSIGHFFHGSTYVV